MRQIDRKLETLVPNFEQHRETWQATRYGKNGRFDYHLDCGDGPNNPSAQREHTALIFLDEPQCGGETHFLLLDLEIKPVAGRLVLWSNFDKNGRRDFNLLHAALPVSRGHKTVLVTWVHRH
jgi:prolyl 4-hydroxylase